MPEQEPDTSKNDSFDSDCDAEKTTSFDWDDHNKTSNASIEEQRCAITILVVDDHESVRGFLAECLNSLGYATFTASGAKEALEIYNAKTSEIALVITDMAMPEISGIELAGRLYDISRTIKVILTTGYDTSTVTAMPPSIIGIIAKPCSIPDLSSAIEKALQIFI